LTLMHQLGAASRSLW